MPAGSGAGGSVRRASRVTELPPHQDQLKRSRVLWEGHTHMVAIVDEAIDVGVNVQPVPLVEGDRPVVALKNQEHVVQPGREPRVQFGEEQSTYTTTADGGIHVDSVQFGFWPEVIEVKVASHGAVELGDQEVRGLRSAAALHAVD